MHLPGPAKHYSSIMLVIFSMVVIFSAPAHAERMNSTNYIIQQDSINVGGNTSTSAGYSANDSLGEIATGEGLQSANYSACAGFQCFSGAPYISFSVREGTSSPGTAGAGVVLGQLTAANVTTSNGTSVNSVFLTAEHNGDGGVVVTVRSQNGALQRISEAGDTIDSATASLVAGTEGYGVCVFSATEAGGSPTTLTESSPYNSTCTKTTGHDVGIIDGTTRTIMSTTGQLAGGEAEVLVKASMSNSTPAGSDYADTLTFIMSATY